MAQEEFSLPDLASFGPSAKSALEGLDKVLSFVSKYGSALPFIKQYVVAIEGLDAAIRAAEGLFKAEPPK